MEKNKEVKDEKLEKVAGGMVRAKYKEVVEPTGGGDEETPNLVDTGLIVPTM